MSLSPDVNPHSMQQYNNIHQHQVFISVKVKMNIQWRLKEEHVFYFCSFLTLDGAVVLLCTMYITSENSIFYFQNIFILSVRFPAQITTVYPIIIMKLAITTENKVFSV
jgi:hypothetical protein